MKILTFILLLLFFQSQNDASLEFLNRLESKPKEYYIEYLDLWKQDSNGCQGKRNIMVLFYIIPELKLDTLKFNKLTDLIGEPNRSYSNLVDLDEFHLPFRKYFSEDTDSFKLNSYYYFADSIMCNEKGSVSDNVRHLDMFNFVVLDINDSIIGYP